MEMWPPLEAIKAQDLRGILPLTSIYLEAQSSIASPAAVLHLDADPASLHRQLSVFLSHLTSAFSTRSVPRVDRGNVRSISFRRRKDLYDLIIVQDVAEEVVDISQTCRLGL